MASEPVTAKAAVFFWETFGKTIASISTSAIKGQWQKFNWMMAETDYSKNLIKQLSTVRILGNQTPIDMGSIYTDVEVLDKLSAMRRFNFNEIKGKPIDLLDSDSRRFSALEIVREHKKTYILGKPGAGKTTFLKHLAILACRGELQLTPIYISLKEWSDSHTNLISFICAQFKICGFPDAEIVVQNILDSGKGLVLLDGLDEVNHEVEKRNKMLTEIKNLTNQYFKSSYCITCRIAANEYTFDQFTYLEIADFNDEQQRTFINKWYSIEPEKLRQFYSQWDNADNNRIHDLARTPLLLTLICLAFDETLQFSKRRVDLYADAVEALLKKWDSSRAIIRGDIYKQLEPIRKRQLLSFIAYKTFNREEYLIRKNVVTEEIKKFISNLPYWDDRNEVDVDQVLNSIESHHGLLIERAHNIYSFSHLTIQEYFAALYISENAVNGFLDDLIDNLLKDIRWREVMLMCSSMQSNATLLIKKFALKIYNIIANDKELFEFIESLQDQATWEYSLFHNKKNKTTKILAVNQFDKSIECALEISGYLALQPEKFRSSAVNRARKLSRLLQENRIYLTSVEKAERLANYLSMTIIFLECLQTSSVDDRLDLEEMALSVIDNH